MKSPAIEQMNGLERILLVDDEEPVLKMISQILERFGYKVHAFDMSTDALNCFRAAPHEFDLIMTDMTMPVMSGDKLVYEAKTIRPDIPVILCTGLHETTLDEGTNGNRPDKILTKPAGKDALLMNIRDLLDTCIHGPVKGENKETFI